MNKLVNVKTIPSLQLSEGCITKMLCDTVNYYRGLRSFGAQIVTAGVGAGPRALSSSSPYKPCRQCVAMSLGSCLELPPGKPAEHGGSLLGHPDPSLHALQEQLGLHCQHWPWLLLHFPALCLLLIGHVLHLSWGLC